MMRWYGMWHGGIRRHRQQLCCLCDLLNPFDVLAFNILDIYRESKFLQGQVALHFRSHGTFTVWTLCELLTSNSVILCHKTNPHYTLHINKLHISYELFRVFKLKLNHPHKHTHTHMHTQPFNGPFTGTTWVSQYQKGKINLDFTEARDISWATCKSAPRSRQTTTQFFTDWMPFLLPNQQCQSIDCNKQVGPNYWNKIK